MKKRQTKSLKWESELYFVTFWLVILGLILWMGFGPFNVMPSLSNVGIVIVLLSGCMFLLTSTNRYNNQNHVHVMVKILALLSLVLSIAILLTLLVAW